MDIEERNIDSFQKRDLSIEILGESKFASPLNLEKECIHFVSDEHKLLYEIRYNQSHSNNFAEYGLLERAGPRENIYFSPHNVRAGILTCGGLCPGLNDVIRSAVRTLWHDYGVKNITGIRYGYQGLLGNVPDNIETTIRLTPEIVDNIHRIGGSMLGSSRGGGPETEKLVDSLEQMNINVLIVIGGDGTQKGAIKISTEAQKRNYRLSVIGVPKTVDNDLNFVDLSFGFRTAVAKAVDVIHAAHQEAISAINGIGLVKVMGRDSGFIAAHTALASHDTNFCLIPEVKFDLNGPKGFLKKLEERMVSRGHAVVLVSEGAGQELVPSIGADKSGNKKLGDIGIFLRNKITDYFSKINIETNLKYIDPSYIVRSTLADASDSIYCSRLGSHAVHAAMSGRNKMVVSNINNKFVYVPMSYVTEFRRKLDPSSSLWRDVVTNLKMTSMVNEDTHK